MNDEKPRVRVPALRREDVAVIRGVPPRVDPFQATRPFPGVVPDDQEVMGMDSATVSSAYQWAMASGYGYYATEGLTFLGYPYLAELTQRPEYRKPAEIIAKEMTRRWIKFTAAGTDDKSAKLKALTEAFQRLGVRDAFRELSEKDGFYGRAHLFLDFGDARDPEELGTALVVKAPKISPESPLRALRVVEPVWVYPNKYDSQNPMVASFYKPQNWFVMGTLVDASRLITFISRAVPDLLKPAYVFGGLSLSQMLKPYVDNWLRTRQSVSDLISSFSKDVLKTNLGAQLQSGESWDGIIARAEAYTAFRDNRNLTLLDKETEEFVTVTTPLSSLDKLQAQAQEQMAGIAGIPLVVLFGITPSGLNASSDGEIRAFYAWIKAQQEDLYRGPLTYVSRIVQLSEFGEIDESIDFEFVPLWEPNETEAAANVKTQADTDQVYVDMGAVSPEEVRGRLARDHGSPYYGLDVSVMPEPPEPDDVPYDAEA